MIAPQAAFQQPVRQRFEVNVLSIGQSGRRIKDRLRETRFWAGDTVVLQGRPATLTEVLSQIGCLPLTERNLGLGQQRLQLLPVSILVISVVLIATHLVPVELAFFVAAILAVLFRVTGVRPSGWTDWVI